MGHSVKSRAAVAVIMGVLGSGGVALGSVAAVAKPKPAPPSSLDSSFGSRGLFTLGTGYQLLAVAGEPNGTLVVAGDQRLRSGVRLVVARLTSAGRLDRSFNRGRVAFGPAVRSGGSVGRAVAIQPDGKIVVAGVLTDRVGTADLGMLAERFTANGTLDRRFGSGGITTVLPGNGQSAANAVALQSGGKIVLGGSGPGSDGYQRLAVARLGSSGQLDRSFGTNGVRIADGAQDLGREGTAAAIALQRNGEIVAAGSAVTQNLLFTNAVVARFSSGGNLDRSFGSGGSYVVPAQVEGGGSALFRAVSVAGDGSIVAAGSAASSGTTSADAIAARLSSNGKPVGSFGNRGVVALGADRAASSPNPLPGASAAAFARSGVVVLAGSFQDSGLTEVALWSLNARGALVSSGTTRMAPGHSLGSGAANGLAIDQHGRIVLVGTSNNFVSFNGFGLRYHGFGA